jgi:predicted DCC family thiol-disulfide oxidoreductase YuxK
LNTSSAIWTKNLATRLGNVFQVVALYDADCGFCERSVAVARGLHLAADFVPLQSVDLAKYGITKEQALAEMAVHDGNRVQFGHHAWATLLKTRWFTAWLGWLMELWPIDPLMARLYRWVAANRYRLPGGTSSCELPPRD